MTKSTKNSKHISKDSVLNDDALDIDLQSDEVEVIASDISVANKAVSDVAVIKNSTSETVSNTSQTAKNTNKNTQASTDKEEQANDDRASNSDDKNTPAPKEAKLSSVKKTAKDSQNDADSLDAQDDTNKASASKDNASSDTAPKESAPKEEAVSQSANDNISDENATDDGDKGVKATVQNLKGNVASLFESAKSQSQELVSGLKQKVGQSFEGAQDKLAHTQERLDDKMSTLKEQGQTLIDDSKEKLGEKLGDLKDAVLSKPSDSDANNNKTANDKTETQADEQILDKEDATQAPSPAQADASEKLQAGKGLFGALGMLGAYLGSAYTAKNDYQAVDLTQSFESDIFHKQGAKIASQLFGVKGATAQNFAKKVVSEDRMNSFSAFVYDKLAGWANAWALRELKNDERFAQLSSLSDEKRERLADDVVNQNRALATLGGVTGMIGLKGVVADTAWLLMVSLKSIYQLAYIYNKPLADKDGAVIAYGILSKCNLDKLQEKQVIMTALALGNTMLVNAQSTSLSAELKKMSQSYHSPLAALNLSKVNELSKFVNLDKLDGLNKKWLHWLLPIGSTAVSAHYNNELIGEVLGVARATFSEQKVLGLLEDKRDGAA